MLKEVTVIVMDNLLTVKEVAEKLRLTEEAVRRLLRSNQLHGYTVQGSWRVKPEDLADYLKRRANFTTEKDSLA